MHLWQAMTLVCSFLKKIALNDGTYAITVEVKNTGNHAGMEGVQLYTSATNRV